MSQLAREVVLGQTSEVVDPQEFTRIAPPRTLSRGSRLSLCYTDHDAEAATPLISAAVSAQNLVDLPSATAVAAFSQRVRFGINASWIVNILLLISKIAAFVLSGSYAVLASAVDSLVDVLSQAILAVAEYQAARFDQRYPIGRTRMAELSVMTCACIMFISTSLVIREALGSLWGGFHGHTTELVIDKVLFIVLGSATVLKLLLYIYCQALRKNPIMVALSEDHLNDVMSNVAAVAGAAVAGNFPRYWWVDPAVAMLFSLLIIRNWMAICWDQGQKMIGLEAPTELIEEVTHVTETHNRAMQLDRVTAYHHGSHMVVEVEVILPATMTVRESHDIALALQHKIEAIENVERAFVHVDYAKRSLEEHKVERNLKAGERDVMKPLVGFGSGPASPSWNHAPGFNRVSQGNGDLERRRSGGHANGEGGHEPRFGSVSAPPSALPPRANSGNGPMSPAAIAAAVAVAQLEVGLEAGQGEVRPDGESDRVSASESGIESGSGSGL